MKKPNLNKIIEDNLDKAKFQSKKQPSLPEDGWLNQYMNTGGTYISDRAQATQFGQYRMGGGMFPEYHSYTPPRMNNGGGLLSRTVTCSRCGWSWKAVDGGSDPMTCHKCGGMIQYGPGGQTTDGCPPNWVKDSRGQCVPSGFSNQSLANSNSNIQQKQKQAVNNAEYLQRKAASDKRQFIGQAKADTPQSIARRRALNQDYVNQHSDYAELDASGNIIQKDPYYTIEGKQLPGSENAIAQRKLKQLSGAAAIGAGTVLTAGSAPAIAGAAYLPESASIVGSTLGKAATPLLAASAAGILGKTATDKIQNPYSTEEKIKLHPKYDPHKSLEAQMNLANDSGIYTDVYRAAHAEPFKSGAGNFAWNVATAPFRSVTNFTQPQQYINQGGKGLALAGLDAASIFTELPSAAASMIKSGAPTLVNKIAPSLIKQEGVNIADTQLGNMAHSVEENAFKHLGKEGAEGAVHQNVHETVHSIGGHDAPVKGFHKRIGGSIGKYFTGGWLDNYL